MSLNTDVLDDSWEGVLWDELTKIAKIKKNLSASHCQALTLLIQMLTHYLRTNPNHSQSSAFLQKTTCLLPSFKDPEQRNSITQLI